MVQVGDVAAVQRQHDDLLAVTMFEEPVVGHAVTDLLGIVEDRQAPGPSQPQERSLSVVVTQRSHHRPLLRVALTAVLGEFGTSMVASERREEAAGVDLSKLAVVADQDQPCVGRSRLAKEPVEVAGPHHPCLIDHEPRGRTENEPPVFQVAQQGGDGGRADARAHLELPSRPSSQRGPDNLVSGGLPRGSDGIECERLAGAGVADDKGDRGDAAGDGLDRAPLLGTQ